MNYSPNHKAGLIVAGLAFAGLAFSVATPAHATNVPATVEVYWKLPAGGTDTNVTWPQAYLADPTKLTCGVYYQVDTYLATEAPLFYADGILTLGEDYSSATQTGAISWRFEFGGVCPPVVVPPVVVPPVVVAPPIDIPVSTVPELAYTNANEDHNRMLGLLSGALALLVGLSLVAWARLRGRRS